MRSVAVLCYLRLGGVDYDALQVHSVDERPAREVETLRKEWRLSHAGLGVRANTVLHEKKLELATILIYVMSSALGRSSSPSRTGIQPRRDIVLSCTPHTEPLPSIGTRGMVDGALHIGLDELMGSASWAEVRIGGRSTKVSPAE